ncbi:hypothetical protein [Oricola sp.]|uniref:hypothetical protein n=1 Tax=Oricola sp. TaxID=1979950 RepID=UPI003BACD3E0
MTDIDLYGQPDIQTITVALFGRDRELDAEAILPLALETFKTHGIEPNFCTVGFKGVTEGKGLTFKTIRKRLEDGTYKELNHLSVLRLYTKGYPNSEDFSVSLDLSFGNDLVVFMYPIDPQRPDLRPARRFVADILSVLTLKYGFALDIPLRLTPRHCAMGFMPFHVHDGLKESGAWQVAWRDKTYATGLFRHVFCLNVLSKPHMEANVGGVSFADWVKKPGHGDVEQLSEHVWLWTVPRKDRLRCAQILHFNGLLTAPDPFQNIVLA